MASKTRKYMKRRAKKSMRKSRKSMRGGDLSKVIQATTTGLSSLRGGDMPMSKAIMHNIKSAESWGAQETRNLNTLSKRIGPKEMNLNTSYGWNLWNENK